MQSLSVGSGLQNLGNTCFFNATLQSLLHAPPMAALLSSHRHSQSCQRKNEWCIFCELERVYSSTRKARIFSPTNLIKNLPKVFRKFRLGRQEDSHQFLRYLVEGMQESETGKAVKEREENERRIRRSKTFDIFGAEMKTVVECLNCSHKSETAERYYDLNIECQKSNSLHEGLASFFAVDKLEGSNKYLCDHCKVRSNARKRFYLDTVPQVATFQLKRFTNSMRKIGKSFPYPFELDMGKHLERPRKVPMKLFGIVVHLGGSSFSGHYYAFVRVGSSWHKMDDSYVSKCSFETVMGQQAYLLFYEREGPFQKEEVQVTPKGEPAKRIEGLKIQNLINGVKIVSSIQKNGKKVVQQNPVQKEERMVPEEKTNGISNKHKGNAITKEHHKDSRVLSEPNFQEIQSLLVRKLSEADVFKQLEDQKNLVGDAISQAVKEVIIQVSPGKTKQSVEESEMEALPRLRRRESKEQMESQLPCIELIDLTIHKIMAMQSKMPARRPQNYSLRSMYNLRYYETKMQKKRKLG